MSGFTNNGGGFTASSGNAISEREQLSNLLDLLGDKGGAGFIAKMAGLKEQEDLAASWVQKSADAQHAAAVERSEANNAIAQAKLDLVCLTTEREHFINQCQQREAALTKREAIAAGREGTFKAYSEETVQLNKRFHEALCAREAELTQYEERIHTFANELCGHRTAIIDNHAQAGEQIAVLTASFETPAVIEDAPSNEIH